MMLIHVSTAVLFAVLAALSFIDARTFRLPNPLTLPLIPAGLLVNALIFDALWTPLAGALIGYGSLVAVEISYRRLRGREGLGRGDAKLFAAAGAWCGGWLLPLILLVGSLGALLYVLVLAAVQRRWPDDNLALPFGPWLAFGTAVAWIYRAYGPGLYPVL